MKIGLFLALFHDRPLAEALDAAKRAGCEAVEISTTGPHRDGIGAVDLEISALSCHGNPLHPDGERAAADDEAFRDTVRLAAELGVGRVITFSGCPGDSEGSERPNWVTCPWPPDFLETLEWQWSEKVAPYWQEASTFAREHGVRVAIELHPGFVAYNTDSFWRLREIGGETIGVNFDPSHLFWQQMDPLVCVRELGDAIYHVHAKDTWVDPQNVRRNGVLDTREYTDEVSRSWIFRTVGYGHGPDFWRAFVSELTLAGYDGVISIEHEDSLISVDEGFTRAVNFLKDTIITQKSGEAWWT
jgi:sugar phosphate isomerase/epimerase